MQKLQETNKWESVHIFFKGDIYSYECDRIILEVVSPFVNECFDKKMIEKFFFIRYSELGTHVRLRFWGKEKNLNDEFKRCCCDYIINSIPKELINYPFKKLNTITADKIEKEDTPYLWVPYEPEIERYGGDEAISVAEDFFFYSSNIVIDLLNKIEKGNNSSRLGFGLILMVIKLFSFFEDIEIVKTILNYYSKGYLSARVQDESEIKNIQNLFDSSFEKQSEHLVEYVNTIWEALSEKTELGEPFDSFKDYCKQIRARLEILAEENKIIKHNQKIDGTKNSLSRILPSYIHMTNNRMGITIPEEAYLAHIIALAFDNSLIQTKTYGEQ